MSTSALIGPDGAGKTAITRKLQESGVLPFRYLYMGVNIAASNVALPTARLAEWAKRRLGRGGSSSAGAPPRSHAAGRRRRGVIAHAWSAARLAHRLADAWFRQLVSWSYELRGYVVLYDRHFALDFVDEIAADASEPLDRRVYRWTLTHLYPKPDVVIFLDAPGAVLHARKGESTVEELERRRQAFLAHGHRLPGFRRVDATRSLPEVYEEVAALVVRHCQPRRTQLPAGAAR
jgi:thymidylate kinase